MRVLWLCNIMLPMIAKSMGKPISQREGWLTGLMEKVIKDRENCGIELGICFPVPDSKEEIKGEVQGIRYYGFYENVKKETEYEPTMEGSMEKILSDFKPDMVHIFGTEFPHTLAMARTFHTPERTLIGIQGVCAACAEHYLDGLPGDIRYGYTLRDFLKKDNVFDQQKKFYLRAQREREALLLVKHVTGRTRLDRELADSLENGIKYHFMNETLRSNFYNHAWDINQCRRHSVFLSQGDYPLKGFHLFLKALPSIKKVYPDTHVYIAGNQITKYDSLKSILKISSYGKYLRELMKKNHLEKDITFLGMVDSAAMCEQMLKANVFVSPSTMENSPNSVGEAMLLGTPVTASNAGGTGSLITDKEDGFLYPAEEVNCLANCVCKIFSDDTIAEKLSKGGRARALKTHDPETNYRRLLEIYREITE